jgi:hypothetical protein
MAEKKKIGNEREPRDETATPASETPADSADDPTASPAVIHHPMANQDAPKQGSG